jgi:HSP20 family molecular chaperone IbpA
MTTTLATYRPSLLGRGVFDDLFNAMDFPTLMNRTTQGYPVADMYQNDNGDTIMEFALAGFQKENLHVEILPEKGEIHVSADSQGEEEQDRFQSRRIARRAFHKTFVNYDNIIVSRG